MTDLILSPAAKLRRLVPLSAAFAILSVVFAILVAIRPDRVLESTQDLQRRSDLQNLVTAIHSYLMEHGDFPADIPTGLPTGREVCRTSETPRPCIDLQGLVGSILNRIPADPVAPSKHTWYYLHVTEQGRLMGNTLGQPPIPLLSVVR